MLSSLRVLELGHYVAAPFCTRLLADLGADVIKIEPPGGDPVRKWGRMVHGRSIWWSMHGRNKRSVALDLKTAAAREVVLRLVAHCDVVVENFRPGQLARLGLGVEALRKVRPNLIVTQISGYGQTGPGANRAAFGVIGEAMGGLRYLTNHVPGTMDLPPVRVGVSIGDSIAGLYAAFGTMAALWQRDRPGGDGNGRILDVALTESVLSMMEGLLPEYGVLGEVRQPAGGGLPTAAPTNAYPTRNGAWVIVAANSDPLFAKLMGLAGRPDLIEAPEYHDNAARVANVDMLDAIIGKWTRQFDAEKLLTLLSERDIPACKVHTAADCARDPQFRARGMVREVEDPCFGTVLQAGIVPYVPDAPGVVRWPGPEIGAHNDEVLSGLLGMSAEELAAFHARLAM